MISFILGIVLIMFFPCLIVKLWHRRPILSFILATFVLILILSATDLIKTFQAMMIYGNDPQLMAGGIAQALTKAIMGLIFLLPLLALFQWGVRRGVKKRLSKEEKADVGKTFS